MGSSTLKRELSGIALLLFAVFLAGALGALALATTHGVTDVRASVGSVGRFLADPLVQLLGWPAAFIVPVIPAVHALRIFGRLARSADRSWMRFLTGVVALLPVGIGLGLGLRIGAEHSVAAGLWGAIVAEYWRMWFGALGAWIVLACASSFLAALTLGWNPLRALLGRPMVVAAAADGAMSLEATEPSAKGKRKKKKDELDLALALAPTPEEMPAVDASLMLVDEPAPLAETDAKADRKRRPRKETAAEVNANRIAAEIDATEDPLEGVLAEELPSSELLTPAPARNAEMGKRELDTAGAKLMAALRTFKVEGELVGRTTGPTVTQFEVEPAAGVKVRQIATLSNDLALAMRAPSIRIVAPIPGKGAVGVEVPNPSPEMVAFRDMIDSKDYQSARAALPIALGKDLEGKPVIADLAKMPHLLIAGATGSGKSVCVNTIITSLIYRHTPRTLRFLMVDPKMVELSVYNTLPHLRHKVITDNRDAAAVLKWAVMEMQERYELLAANGCRNLQDFNRRVQDGAPLKTPPRPEVAFEDRVYKGSILPYIVVVIDEMADLMMTVQGEVETPIAMLAQKARAIGIHLILATQRPSVNVITGLIKANFPSRIAFRVASQIDSRTIIDGGGAEMLLGNGDMLFIPPGKSEPSRLQGAYLSSEDTERLMGWYESMREAKRQRAAAGGVQLDERSEVEDDILAKVREREAELSRDGDAPPDRDAKRDDLFRDAAECVIHNQLGSTSLLQRKLEIGYGRAARIIDQLHAAGVLGPANGSKAREVLVGLEDLDAVCGSRG